ncbi:MAG: SufD family Fe-S cluster assembly protein [Coriobacteriales bacterium]|nr:SufD family Fe-S cluster assembly protein [Coriobacteriales bacterium]
MEARTLNNVSAMPAPTWHWLHMNDATVEVPEGLDAASDFAIDAAEGTSGAFDAAMAAAQKAWDAEHEGYEYQRNYTDEQAEKLGGTSLSAYQQGVDEVEASKDLARMFDMGMGGDATAYLREVAGTARVIEAKRGEHASASVRIAGLDGHANVAALDIVAAADSELDVCITVDSPTPGTGLTGSTIRVFAGDNAKVTITRVQTLDDSWIDLDDMGLFLGNQADVQINQTVLGAGKTYTGLAGDLRGTAANANVVTRYLGHGDQKIDFNYTLRHHGRKTTCNLYANGVLAGTSTKTLRGTIDLIRGAKGAEGKETDNVLLVDEGVHNKTVPTILCNEDDVMGNHGATIGHIRKEQMFYMASRGLSQKQAEAMFVSASLEDAYIEAPNDATREAVVRLGNKLVDGFGELVEDKEEELA